MSRDFVEPRVTDHAVLRYIERVYGVDVDHLRSLIMTDLVRNAILAGATKVKSDGFVYVLGDNAVVTIMEPYQRPRLKGSWRVAEAEGMFA